MPYRDFFDHHGFLLTHLLAPLTTDQSLTFIKAFYYLVTLLNLFLVLKILKKVTSKIGFGLGGILFVFIAIAFFTIKKKFKKIVLPVSFLICSLIFLLVGYGRAHLVPAGTFFCLLMGYAFKEIKGRFKYFFFAVFSIYLVLLAINAVEHYFYLNRQRVPYIENKKSKSVVAQLKKHSLDQKKLYVFGNQAEIYYLLNLVSATYFPLKFPFLGEFVEGFEERAISDIKKNKVEVVVIPKPVDKLYLPLKKLEGFIKENYQPVAISPEVEVYSFKNY